MSYSIKEIYYTIQGEGRQTGRPAVFLRFAGCNLWSGREEDRPTAVCRFCDTDFVGIDGVNGGRFDTAAQLADAVRALWPGSTRALTVLTGGEPMLQVDHELITELHARDIEIAIETNGTIEIDLELDWICVSPKAGAELRQIRGNELKLVYPQPELQPSALEELDFDHFLLQPMDGPNLTENRRLAVEYCLAHPRWQLSLQTHKLMGLP